MVSLNQSSSSPFSPRTNNEFPGCENAQLVSALNTDDTGTTNIANSLFSLPSDIVGTILGPNVNLNGTAGVIPAVGTGSSAGSAACLAKCQAQDKMVKRTW